MNQGFLNKEQAKECLTGRLDPDDPNTACDDSELLEDVNAFAIIERQEEARVLFENAKRLKSLIEEAFPRLKD